MEAGSKSLNYPTKPTLNYDIKEFNNEKDGCMEDTKKARPRSYSATKQNKLYDTVKPKITTRINSLEKERTDCSDEKGDQELNESLSIR